MSDANREVGYIRIRTPDDPEGWTAEGYIIAGEPYVYSSGDVAVEVVWGDDVLPTALGEFGAAEWLRIAYIPEHMRGAEE